MATVINPIQQIAGIRDTLVNSNESDSVINAELNERIDQLMMAGFAISAAMNFPNSSGRFKEVRDPIPHDAYILPEENDWQFSNRFTVVSPLLTTAHKAQVASIAVAGDGKKEIVRYDLDPSESDLRYSLVVARDVVRTTGGLLLYAQAS